ncbi:hypothetical protein IAQ61_003456 [Plenodomus lingam]|uniref:Heterokaryon incompatibility domain-containing protein n=1 Tax=Leptosphaeria maculans (strain JN3 / isolate v23.1.3 / race Av1-4-5-6-7-8) TaxID=985895 RepID=E5AEK5_LEPMJ|nr:hypothetical protein LEMA_P004310.1 [Plenodomus lingam JN3]KAH9875991.1 hypothetical protein IAQ61_003456 [Plenodomus lingam]CBY01644.1 hypothetical protein LEMA_P004310.1 [Plenodomus lingam JN3]
MQVAMIQKIFSRASCVIMWLGPEEDQSSEALAMMQNWADQIRVDRDNFLNDPREIIYGRYRAEKRSMMKYKKEELESMTSLLRRPYFERLWVRQEVGLASSALLRCGRKEIEWQDTQEVVFCLMDQGFDHSPAPKIAGPMLELGIDRAFELCLTRLSKIRLTTLRYRTQHALCSDKRDYLFAILDLLCQKDQSLGITPHYTCTAEDLFTDTTKRYIDQNSSLDLLLTCELSSKSLEIPTWVPDWSSPITLGTSFQEDWSVCGWISAQATFLAKDQLLVKGIVSSQVECVIDTPPLVGNMTNPLEMLRELQSMTQLEHDQSWENPRFLRQWIGLLFEGWHTEDFQSPQETFSTYSRHGELLSLILSSDETSTELQKRMSWNISPALNRIKSVLMDRCFVQMWDKRFGLAPAGTQADDIAAVLLGCRAPIIIRPLSQSEAYQTCKVIGHCRMPGIMRGDTIYRNRLPKHCHFVWRESWKNDELIDDSRCALYNPETGEYKTNPAEILEEVGIKVESYQRDPHKLIVLPETLRAAGIPLKDFVIVYYLHETIISPPKLQHTKSNSQTSTQLRGLWPLQSLGMKQTSTYYRHDPPGNDITNPSSAIPPPLPGDQPYTKVSLSIHASAKRLRG